MRYGASTRLHSFRANTANIGLSVFVFRADRKYDWTKSLDNMKKEEMLRKSLESYRFGVLDV